jgi:ribosome maturation factor RimP
LEVSSPGVDEPLVLYRQYLRNVGRSVHVELQDGRQFDGLLLAADEQGIELEEVQGKGKKKEVVKHFLLFGDLKKTTVNIVF